MLTKIISGGQTRADRAALDLAIEFGIPGVCLSKNYCKSALWRWKLRYYAKGRLEKDITG
jgi:hypothetical protein